MSHSSADHYLRIESLYQRAMDLPVEQRASFIAAQCGDDAGLRHEVETLLDHYEAAGREFLGRALHNLSGAALSAALPTRIGRYEILRLIAQGGMGMVFEAQQDNPRRHVAVKVIRAGISSAESLRRFEHEAAILGRLQHPAIAHVYEAGMAETETPGGRGPAQPFFAMEFIRGVSLLHYVRRHQLGPEERLELFCRICDAVEYAHQKGVIHRDLKPGNILVVEQGADASRPGSPAAEDSALRATIRGSASAPSRGLPKILDFGVARVTDSDLQMTTMHTHASQVVGTLPYMSPEQVSGNAEDLDTRSDVYSLGVILYELLADRLPYQLADANIPAAARVISETAPAPLSGVNRVYRGDLETIVHKALEKEPSRRYGSVYALSSDIRHYLNREPIAARPASAMYQLRKFAQRHQALVWGAVTTVAALVLAVAGTGYGLVRAEQRRAEADVARAQEARQRRVAEEQRTLAQRREKETQLVADFQSRVLQDVNAETMGRSIMLRLRQHVKAGLEKQMVGDWPDRRKRTPQEVEAALAAFDAAVLPAQPIDVARRVMDENVLKRAARAIEKQFAEQPLVQARLHDALGTSYKVLGLLSMAESHYSKALELFRAARGDDHLDVAAGLESLALLLIDEGKLDQAEPMLSDALAMRRRLVGDHHVDVASSLQTLGLLAHRKGDFAGAMQYYERALALRRELLPADDPAIATTLDNLGTLRGQSGDFDGGEKWLREALALRRKKSAPDQPNVAHTLNNLGILLYDRGDFAASESCLREALDIRRKVYGGEHPDVASSLNNLAGMLCSRGDFAAAEPLLREALDLQRKLLGKRNANVATTLNNLAAVYRSRGDFDSAEPMLREAVEMYRDMLGEEHHMVLTGLNNLAVLLRQMKKYDEAEPLFKEALALRRRVLGEAHTDVASSLDGLAGMYRQMTRYDEARPLFEEAVAIRRRALGDEHPDTALSVNNYAVLLHDMGEPAAAEPMYREALAVRIKKLPRGHLDIAQTRTSLGRALSDMAANGSMPRDERVVKLDEAEKLLLTAHAALEKVRHPPIGRLRACVDGLAQLYERRHALEPDAGFDQKATEWAAKADALRDDQPADKP